MAALATENTVLCTKQDIDTKTQPGPRKARSLRRCECTVQSPFIDHPRAVSAANNFNRAFPRKRVSANSSSPGCREATGRDVRSNPFFTREQRVPRPEMISSRRLDRMTFDFERKHEKERARAPVVRAWWRRPTGSRIDPRGSPLPHLDTRPTPKSTGVPVLPSPSGFHQQRHPQTRGTAVDREGETASRSGIENDRQRVEEGDTVEPPLRCETRLTKMLREKSLPAPYSYELGRVSPVFQWINRFPGAQV